MTTESGSRTDLDAMYEADTLLDAACALDDPQTRATMRADAYRAEAAAWMAVDPWADGVSVETGLLLSRARVRARRCALLQARDMVRLATNYARARYEAEAEASRKLGSVA